MTHSELSIRTKAKSLINITDAIEEVVSSHVGAASLCNLFILHTSCSLIISENCDPDVLADLNTFMSRVVSEDEYYAHSLEGKDDMPAHIRSVLTQTSLSLPMNEHGLILGRWQGVYVWEHRARSYERQVVVTII